MHGRLKVKSPAQQEAEKKLERQEKLKTYETAMATIFENRRRLKKLEQDKEDLIKAQFKMTAGILMANPDISTLWNIRKQLCQLHLGDAALKKELDLTVQCLQTNPKSYGAWHHRCWSMLHMEKPNWDYEMSLCNKYLSLDERNFHCWDYRRFVVNNSKALGNRAKSELDFSFEKIQNISNYSAWHYRSKLCHKS